MGKVKFLLHFHLFLFMIIIIIKLMTRPEIVRLAFEFDETEKVVWKEVLNSSHFYTPATRYVPLHTVTKIYLFHIPNEWSGKRKAKI